MRARFILLILGFGMLCKPVDTHNPGILYSNEWWETTFVRCITGELEACVPGPKITGALVSKYISNSSGAINITSLNWTSDSTGTYTVLTGSTNCSNGTVLDSGAVTAGVNNLLTIDAMDIPIGNTYLRICVIDDEDGDLGSGIFNIIRDDTAPSVDTNPINGIYNSSKNVSIVCSDTGGAGCSKIAYVTDSSTPDIQGDTGTINVGTQYTSPINVAANTSTTFKFVARDKSGNVSTVYTSTVATDTQTPTSTSINPSNGAAGIPVSPGSITIQFAEPMDTSLTMSMTTEINDGTNWVAAYNSYTMFDWADPQTLVITISWVYFPESSSIRWTIPSSSLKDLAGNSMTQTGIFSTGIGSTPSGTQTYTGPTQNPTYTADYTTYDSSTGLTWKTCWEGISGATCGAGTRTEMPWYQAIDGCAYLNSIHGTGIGYAQRQNWRLPTADELFSLVEGSSNPFINTTAFPNPVATATWTASRGVTNTPYPQFARTIVFAYGIYNEFDKTISYAVHCVSD
ncbi:DUF1566 domain-containing protein [Leptospira sarikeiensis]|uniref:DUF1566 domain-containing protein n=1 Tax=Leptospira sarikeiensis TaxID=2484943 RepID=A0A4R9K628_9LEPT|nr:DUF1566 domain-containing protein [Leptospira sarikeiensis]TGL60767.1 DUF1566 domain-containing protein [Leptospira sarikeiensis]